MRNKASNIFLQLTRCEEYSKVLKAGCFMRKHTLTGQIKQLTSCASDEKNISLRFVRSLKCVVQMPSPMMDTIAAPMMKGALTLHLLEKYTVIHIEKLASTFGGTVILVGILY